MTDEVSEHSKAGETPPDDAPPAAESPEEERAQERAVLARLGDEVVRRRMTMPAIFLLESMRPLTFLASQGLIFFEPIVKTILNIKDYDTFARAVERRDNVEWLIQYMEDHEATHNRRDEGEAQ